MTSSTTTNAAAERLFVPRSDGPRVAYFEAGSGPDLVLLHGTMMNADEMRLGPMATLARQFRTVTFDRPGHGHSDRLQKSEASLWRQAEILREAAGALGLRKPVLVGHSYGGAVALAWAMSFPDEVAGVVAIGPPCFPEPRLEHIVFAPRAVPVGGDMLARALHLASDPLAFPALWRAMFLPQQMPERLTAEFSFELAGEQGQTVREGENAAAMVPDLTRSALSYPTLRVPVSFLCGSADLVVNPYVNGLVASQLIPGATIQWFPGLGHMLHHFEPENVLAAAAEVATRAGSDGR